MTDNLSSRFEKYIALNFAQKIILISLILSTVSMLARVTYQAGTDKVAMPELLRRYNELIHRISTQLLFIAKADLDRMPDNIFFKMISEEVTALGISKVILNELDKNNF